MYIQYSKIIHINTDKLISNKQKYVLVVLEHNIQANTLILYILCWFIHLYIIQFARELMDPSWCCALFCLAFLVHIICSYCTGWICHLTCGVNVIVTNFVGKWRLILSVWHPIPWRRISLNPLHVVILQFILL